MAIYNAKAVEEYLNDPLETNLEVEGWCNIDSTLTAKDGDSIRVYRYTGSGSAEVVAEGNGNSGYSDIDGVYEDYTIQTYQDRCKITDEEEQRNAWACDRKLDIVLAHITNALREDVVDEWYKSNNYHACAGDVPTMAEFLAGELDLDLGVDQGENGGKKAFKCFINPADLNAYDQYLAGLNLIAQYDIINGKRFRTINGIPVEVSDLIAEGQPIYATADAVRLMRAKSVSAETERDANIRTTTYYARQVARPYLEFSEEVVIFGKGLAITKASATHGSFTVPVKAVEGELVAIEVTPDSGYVLNAISVADASSAAVTVTNQTFVMPDSAVTVTVTFKSAS